MSLDVLKKSYQIKIEIELNLIKKKKKKLIKEFK